MMIEAKKACRVLNVFVALEIALQISAKIGERNNLELWQIEFAMIVFSIAIWITLDIIVRRITK